MLDKDLIELFYELLDDDTKAFISLTFKDPKSTDAYNELKKQIENGETLIITMVSEDFLNNYKDLVFLAVNMGFNISGLINSAFVDDYIKKIIASDYEMTKKVIEEQYADIIDYSEEEFLETYPDLIALALNNGYRLNYETKDIVKKRISSDYELIKQMIKKDVDTINYIEDEFLKSHPDLIDLSLANGYKLKRWTKDIIQKRVASDYEMTKKVIEEQYPNIIDYSEEKFLEKHSDLIGLAFANGYHEFSYSVVKKIISSNYGVTKKVIEEQYPNIIDYSEEKFLEKHPDLIELAVSNGYHSFRNSTIKKIIASDYEMTKKVIEEQYANIINDSEDEFLEEHPDLIELALDNGYIFDYHTKYIIKKIIASNYNLAKKVIEAQDANIIDDSEDKFLETHPDLIDLALDHHYIINSNSHNIILNNAKYIKRVINNGQSDAVKYATDKVFAEDINLIIYAFEKGYWQRITCIEDDNLNENEIFDDKQIKVLSLYCNIDDLKVAKEFKKYILNNYETLNDEKIDIMADLYYRLTTTNSKILYSMKNTLANQIQYLNNPLEDFNKIEKIFLKNNIPIYAKMYLCFKILYPNLKNAYNNMDFSDQSRMAPQLKDMSLPNIKHFNSISTNEDIRFYIIYNDLVRNAVKSNSMDLRNYLDNIELGDYLYKKILGENISNENFDSISDEEKEYALDMFASHLETIYNNTLEGKNNNLDLSNYDLAKKIKILKDKFKVTDIHDLKDRIVRMFCYGAGFTSFEQIRNEMNKTIKEANDRGIKYANELKSKKFEFEDGDFLRCIGDYWSFAGSIENGNYSKEFLTVFKGTNNSDTTPLDIDLSLIKKKKNIYESIEGTPTGFGFGNVYLIIKKDNPNLNITRDSNNNLIDTTYKPDKLEIFGTGYETHFGIRTGMSLTDVDYILYKEDRKIDSNKPYNEDGSINYVEEPINYDDLSRIKYEIAKHGYYIPVIDFTGQLIYSVEEYNNLREKMNGLSHYDKKEYIFSDNLIQSGTEYLNQFFEMSNNDIITKKNKLYNILESILSELNLKTKYRPDDNLVPGYVEILDTGSTGRGTNDIFSGDFDLLFRLDQQLYRDTAKFNELKDNIINRLTSYPCEKCGITDNGDLRLKKVQIDDECTIDIDISFVIKTDKMMYSTDECLKDRLETIKKQDKDKYNKVILNICIAKRKLKEAGCYKPSRSDSEQGGLGGAGIENWILQNGGSFYDAIIDFLSVANNYNSFEEFRKQYYIWDFGENFFAERKGKYPYDNFVDNMNDVGFNKMKNYLNKFIMSYNNHETEEHLKTL